MKTKKKVAPVTTVGIAGITNIETKLRPLKETPRAKLDKAFQAIPSLAEFKTLYTVPTEHLQVIDELTLRKGFAYAVALWGDDEKPMPSYEDLKFREATIDKVACAEQMLEIQVFKKNLFTKMVADKGFAGKYPALMLGTGNYATPEEYAIMPKKEKEASKVEQKPASAVAKRTTTDAECTAFADKPGGKEVKFELRKDSVLHVIFQSWALKNGSTKEETLERLVAAFPDREGEKMASTIQTQINRMPKEKEFHLGRDDKGRYGIHIEGRSSTRVLSADAQKKADARALEREEALTKETAEKAEAKALKEKEKAEELAKQAKDRADAAAKLAKEKADEAAKKAKAAAAAAKA